MSDSAKLRFVYGILSLIGAFICFGVFISSIFLLIFLDIPEEIAMLTVFCFLGFIFFSGLSTAFFIASGKIAQKNFRGDIDH